MNRSVTWSDRTPRSLPSGGSNPHSYTPDATDCPILRRTAEVRRFRKYRAIHLTALAPAPLSYLPSGSSVDAIVVRALTADVASSWH